MSGSAWLAWRGLPAVFLPLLALGVVLSPTGFYSIDEGLYYAGAEALWRTGDFVVDNGFAEFGSINQKLWFLVEGPRGLVPQYPAGHAVIGAPLLGLFGIRGLILLNAAAAVATLFLTRALALRLFGDARVAGLAVILLAVFSFWPDYAVAVWPHSAALFCVLLAFHLAYGALDAGGGTFGTAAAAGIAAGAGLFFRVDSVLVLPVLVALAILFAGRPVAMLAGGLTGLALPVAVATWLNWVKFGVALPVTYGDHGDGGTALSSHVWAIAAVLMAFGLLVAWRGLATRPVLRRRALSWLLAILGLMALALPNSRAALAGALDGAAGLFLAFQFLLGEQAVSSGPVRTALYGGIYPKTALAQSMPWLGFMVLGLGQAWTPRDRRALMAIVAFAVIWSLPFVPIGWHGGLSGNMRYFLPLLPLLAALGARILLHWMPAQPRPLPQLLGGATGALACAGAWAVAVPGGIAGAEQWLTFVTFVSLVGVATLAARGVFGGLRLRIATSVLIGAGLVLASLCATLDLYRSAQNRTLAAQVAADFAPLEGRAVVWGSPALFPRQMTRDDQILAIWAFGTGEVDVDFVEATLEAGYRTYLPSCVRHRFDVLAERIDYAETGYATYYCDGFLELRAFTAAREGPR